MRISLGRHRIFWDRKQAAHVRVRLRLACMLPRDQQEQTSFILFRAYHYFIQAHPCIDSHACAHLCWLLGDELLRRNSNWLMVLHWYAAPPETGLRWDKSRDWITAPSRGRQASRRPHAAPPTFTVLHHCKSIRPPKFQMITSVSPKATTDEVMGGRR
jgi:hypothetical protein